MKCVTPIMHEGRCQDNTRASLSESKRKQVLQTTVVFSVEKHIKTSVSEPEYSGHVCAKDYELQIITAKYSGPLWAQSILDASQLVRNDPTATGLPTNSNNFYSQTHQSNCMYDMVLEHGFLTRKSWGEIQEPSLFEGQILAGS